MDPRELTPASEQPAERAHLVRLAVDLNRGATGRSADDAWHAGMVAALHREAERQAEESLRAAMANADAALRTVRTPPGGWAPAGLLVVVPQLVAPPRRLAVTTSGDDPPPEFPSRRSPELALVPRRELRDWARRRLRELNRLQAVTG